MHIFDFKWRRGQPCRWLSCTNNGVRAHVGDVIIVWRNTHNNMEPNAVWFLATLTDTDLNIQGILVKYCTNGNSNIPATESRLWGTKWYNLFSSQVRMLRRGAFWIFIQWFSIERLRTASPCAVLQRARVKGVWRFGQARVSWTFPRPHCIWQQWNSNSPHWSTAYDQGNRKLHPHQAWCRRHPLQSQFDHWWAETHPYT